MNYEYKYEEKADHFVISCVATDKQFDARVVKSMPVLAVYFKDNAKPLPSRYEAQQQTWKACDDLNDKINGVPTQVVEAVASTLPS